MKESTWIIGADGLPTNAEFIDVPEKSMEKPYPKAVWRIDPAFNNGLPYHELLPGIRSYHFEKIIQNEYITVYSHLTKQDDFDNNGLAVLQPLSCEITEELNGDYSLQIKLPIDGIGKWKFVKEMNYIKALGQIFRINQVEFNTTGKKSEISAQAMHVFYIQNDWAIDPQSFVQMRSIPGSDPPQVWVYDLIDGMTKTMHRIAINKEQGIPKFLYASNIKGNAHIAVEKYGKIGTLESFSTTTELIMGSDSYISNFGGELYRDNFYYSICEPMEYSSDNAFDIRIGRNLRGIKRTVDMSTFCTWLRGVDNFGALFGVSYTEDIIDTVPHNITRVLFFRYDDHDFDVLAEDTMKYWRQYGVPVVSYTVDLDEVLFNSEFQEFTGKPKYKVGNKGTIYDERLGMPIKLKITKTKTDAITGKIISVTFGATRQFMNHNSNTQVIELDVPVYKESLIPVRDSLGRQLRTSDGYKVMKKMEV